MHYSDYDSFSSAYIGFGNLCRSRGLNVGIMESKESMMAALLGLQSEPELLRYGLKSIFCINPEQTELFDELYDRFWLKAKTRSKGKTLFKNQSNITRRSKASIVMLGIGKNERNRETAHHTSGANAKESLKKTDFNQIADEDSEQLDRLSHQLYEQMSLRLRRKLKKSRQGGIDIKRTIRSNMGSGGSMIELIKKNRRKQKYKLVILLDVSGSMDKYSFYLLKFILALKSNFKEIEAFVFSTKLMRITAFLDHADQFSTLHAMSHQVNHWSSGTKIGACLKDFNDNFAKRVLHGKTMTIVLSDGLDTGDTQLLSDQIVKIKLRTNKLIWLNPLKGMERYEPIQRGMKVAIPALDHFAAANNVSSLLKLEEILANA